MQILIHLLTFLEPYGTHAYFIMFAILIACGFGLPMPEDVVLVTGGILSSHAVTHFSITNAVCLAGVLIGDGTIFFLGRKIGPRLKSRGIFKRLLNEKREATARALFQKYGDKVIFIARFMPGFRTPIFFSSGTFGVSPAKFFALDGIAALISVPLWIYLGHLFGENLEELERKMRQFQFGIYFVLAGLVILFVGYAFFKKRALKKIGAAS